MSKKQSKVIFNDKPLIIPLELALKIGVNEAIFIQQLHYLLQSSKHIIDGERWIYNTHKEWTEQLPIFSESTLARTLKKLLRMGLIIRGNHNKLSFDRTLWYRINYEEVARILEAAVPVQSKGVPLQDNVHSKCHDHVVNMTTPYSQNDKLSSSHIDCTNTKELPENYYKRITTIDNNGTFPDKPEKDSEKNNNSSFCDEEDIITDPDLFLPFDTFPLDDLSIVFNVDFYSFNAEEVGWYFAATYREHRSEEHPRCSLTQLKQCFDSLSEFDLDTDTVCQAIKSYFGTELDCDYRFSHFCTPGVLKNRLFELGYIQEHRG